MPEHGFDGHTNNNIRSVCTLTVSQPRTGNTTICNLAIHSCIITSEINNNETQAEAMELEISEAEVLAPSNKKEIKKARKGSSSRM